MNITFDENDFTQSSVQNICNLVGDRVFALAMVSRCSPFITACEEMRNRVKELAAKGNVYLVKDEPESEYGFSINMTDEDYHYIFGDKTWLTYEITDCGFPVGAPPFQFRGRKSTEWERKFNETLRKKRKEEQEKHKYDPELVDKEYHELFFRYKYNQYTHESKSFMHPYWAFISYIFQDILPESVKVKYDEIYANMDKILRYPK